LQKLVYLSLGSNLGDRRANLEAAIAQLTTVGEVTKVSSFYATTPVEFIAQPEFLNCAVELRTQKMPRQLMAALLAIERALGRKRERTVAARDAVRVKGPRVIDIDIVLFGHSTVNTAALVIPHPAMHERRFVLEPLAEIAPDARHPVLNQTVRELRDALPAGQPLRKIQHSDTEAQSNTNKSKE
jgi:2-amino-4-hydroxy-6-hydroxymethyldihydropteridine diphosphokinase